MRKMVVLAAGTVLAVSLALGTWGCTRGSKEEAVQESTSMEMQEDTQEPCEITYFTWVQSADGQYPQNMLDAFHDKYPWITVNFEKATSQSADRLQNLKVKLLSGEGVDVVTMTPGDWNTIMEAGYIEGLSGEDFLDAYSEADLAPLTVDGNIYGIPYAKDVIGVMYNKDLFAENGWEIPDCKEEWLALCEKAADAGITPMVNGAKDGWPMGNDIVPFVHGLYVENPDIFEKIDAKEKKYTDPEFVACFNEISDYFRSRAVSPDAMGLSYDQALTYFANGKAAMICHGEWAMALIKEAEPDFEVGVFQIPYNEQGETQIGCSEIGQYQVITTISDNKEAAKLLLDYMSSEEGAGFFTASMGNFSAVQGAVTPGMEMWDSLVNDYDTVPFYYDQMFTGTKTEMFSQLQLLFTGDTTVEEALLAIQSAQDKKE